MHDRIPSRVCIPEHAIKAISRRLRRPLFAMNQRAAEEEVIFTASAWLIPPYFRDAIVISTNSKEEAGEPSNPAHRSTPVAIPYHDTLMVVSAHRSQLPRAWSIESSSLAQLNEGARGRAALNSCQYVYHNTYRATSYP
jgi:hypothetical protein